MLANLKRELSNRGVSLDVYADFLGVSGKSARNKINEETPLTYPEAEKTQKELFPGYDFLYLFASDKEEQKVGNAGDNGEGVTPRAVTVPAGT